MASGYQPTQLSHDKRMEACLAGASLDRPPVALWRHFPVEDQDPGWLAAATLQFQKTYDFDLVKVTPASSFCLKDWGAQDEWRGNTEGTRSYTKQVILQPEDWARLQVLEPTSPHLAAQLECLRQIRQGLGTDTPIIQTIFSPLSQAKNLVGEANLLVHMRRYPEAVHAAFKVMVETTRLFIEAAARTGIAGIFYAVQQAQYGLLSTAEFDEFGRAYDLQVLEAARDLWLNMLHLHGQEVMFAQLADYPVQVINWHDLETAPSLAEGQEMFPGAVCGGLRRWDTLVTGTPEQVTAEARAALQATGGKRFILGTGCVLPIIAPHSNILAARTAVCAD